MDGSIKLSASERKVLLSVYRSCDGKASRRAHIVLLLSDGFTWREIRVIAYASNDLIASSVRAYRREGIGMLKVAEQDISTLPCWADDIADWITGKTPQDFGYFRTRWSCEILAEVLAWEKGIRRSGETLRRFLRKLGFAWRRPRPILKRVDPAYQEKLRKIQYLLKTLPSNHTAVFQDEVDINLNPKIGAAWMVAGCQATVITPGNNEKRYLAGSLHWRTGRLILSDPGRRRDSELFLRHLDDLRRRFRSFRKIHVICDNAGFHGSRSVMEYLHDYRDRIEIHFLPVYAPETNPIERVWWHLHEVITRNHQCKTIHELLQQTKKWVEQHPHFEIETSLYDLAA